MTAFHYLLRAGRAVACTALTAVALIAQAEPRACLIVGVSDGDTLTARCGVEGSYEQIKVRLNGIDAPEKRQPFGERAKQAMSDLTFGKVAQLDCFKADRYGRSVCKVMVAPTSSANDGPPIDAGLAMVSAGMAWWYRAYAPEQTAAERAQYEAAETKAKAEGVGLWRDAGPVAPWDWRKDRRAGG